MIFYSNLYLCTAGNIIFFVKLYFYTLYLINYQWRSGYAIFIQKETRTLSIKKRVWTFKESLKDWMFLFKKLPCPFLNWYFNKILKLILFKITLLMIILENCWSSKLDFPRTYLKKVCWHCQVAPHSNGIRDFIASGIMPCIYR